MSTRYDLFDQDPILGYGGADYVTGTPYGLIAPGEGPGLRIRAGHTGWITVHVALHDSEPEPDLDRWEAIEQVTIEPAGEVRVASQGGEIEEHYPDLSRGRRGHLAIRVSVRGRDQYGMPISAINPRRTPLEDHLIDAWPVAQAAPRVVLKRDNSTRNWEKGN